LWRNEDRAWLEETPRRFFFEPSHFGRKAPNPFREAGVRLFAAGTSPPGTHQERAFRAGSN
jgi:hypothetical protein